MAIITARKETVLPVGDYGLEVLGVTHEQGQFGWQFKFEFVVTAPKKFAELEKRLVAWTNDSNTIKSKFIKWVSAIYNREIIDGEQIDTDKLIARRVIGVIITEDKDDGTYNKIYALKPYGKQSPMPFEGAGDDDSDDFEVGAPEDIFADE